MNEKLTMNITLKAIK